MASQSPLISSAQNREDLFLYALLGDIKKGFYVDVGANHAELHSVTKMFYDKGWRGINLEPNPLLHKELKQKRRRDINLNIGISDKSGNLLFRTYPNQDGLSTFSSEIMKEHEASGYVYEDSYIPVAPLSLVFKENSVTSIDFLKIDVEGYELEVVNSNNWKKWRPRVVIIEATVRKKLDPLMKSLGYRLEFFDGLNNYYVDAALSDITIHNYAGRVLMRGFYTHRELAALKAIENIPTPSNDVPDDLKGLRNSTKHFYRSLKAYVKWLLGPKK